MSINLGGNSPKKITMRTASKLPAEYQEVEYIQSSGTQYIETPCILQDGYIYKTKLQYTQLGWGNFGGYYSSSGTPRFYLGLNGENNTWGYGMGSSFGRNLGTPTTGTDYEIEAKLFNGSQYLKVNGNTLYSNTFTYSSSEQFPIYVFAETTATGAGAWIARAKIYYFQLYDTSNVLALDLVPCYRIADSVIGMYDLVNNTFYTNSGSGTFTKGNDVLLEKEIKRITIRPNGTEKQIRPAGWQPGANTIAYYPLTEDTLDHVGNYSITTKSGTTPSQQTIGYNFTARATVALGNNVDRTISMWAKVVSASTTGYDHYIDLAETQKYNIQYQYYHGNISALNQAYCSWLNAQYTSHAEQSYTVNANTWYHFCSVADTDNNKMYGYINGVKVFELNQLGAELGLGYASLWFDRNGSNNPQSGVATLSECIIEDKARTAQEVSDYYNGTKGNYGL